MALIKLLLKKLLFDPGLLANCGLISKIPLISIVLERVVVKRVLDNTEVGRVEVRNDFLMASHSELISVLFPMITVFHYRDWY